MKLPRRLRARDGGRPLVSPAVLEGLTPGDRLRVLAAVERLGDAPRPCVVCDTPTDRWRPIIILEPDSLLFGMPLGQSFLCICHFCPRHAGEADALRFRAALIAEARHQRN